MTLLVSRMVDPWAGRYPGSACPTPGLRPAGLTFNGPESNAAAATRSVARTWRPIDDLLAVHSRELTEAAARMGTVEAIDRCRRGNRREDGDGTCRACKAVATRESRLRRRRLPAG